MMTMIKIRAKAKIKVKAETEGENKVWIEDDRGKVVFGGVRKHMLEAIDRLGSMNKAAKALKMSYRALWARIKSTENRIGAKLVTTRPGGGKGRVTVGSAFCLQFHI
jgi:molybdenum-dependent DNA-binding transcriptional regulator ModE